MAFTPNDFAALNSAARLPARDATLQYLLQPLRPLLDRPGVLEVVLNRPGVVFVEDAKGWARHELPELTLERCRQMATATANYTEGNKSLRDSPLLGATLPTGERVQFALPPVVHSETISITIRKPPTVSPTMEDIHPLLERVRPWTNELQDHERELLELHKARKYWMFLMRAVQLRLTIVVSGHTGAGKTYVLKALSDAIPTHLRVVTIENVAELLLPRHENAVHLFYADSVVRQETPGQQRAITAKELLAATLRMRPDWVMLAEARSGDCFDFIDMAASAHPGLSSVHAGSIPLAFERMALMIRRSPEGQGLGHEEIKRLLTMTVDVIAQFGHDGSGRHISGIYYNPQRKLQLAAQVME
jgi:type IV secretion system protein VirB11